MTRVLITGGKGNIATIIKNNLQHEYDILNPSHQELDILDINQLTNYLKENKFDILIHTAILGGRRTKTENYDIVYKNLLMFENLMRFSESFKMIINLDSAAIYDRQTDILNRKESEIFTIPKDFYGFSKYLIYQRSLNYPNIYNFRIFNIFHANEEPDRFIKSCFIAKQNNTKIIIYEDKYFDFVYEIDFIKILKHYMHNLSNTLHLCTFKTPPLRAVMSEQGDTDCALKMHNGVNLYKTINICYSDKHKLSEIAKQIVPEENINILSNALTNNYCGDGSLFNSVITYEGLKSILDRYECVLKSKDI
jgi:nucleoside-diphosphate-sugar epimerase